jgi:hypothetical protein
MKKYKNVKTTIHPKDDDQVYNPDNLKIRVLHLWSYDSIHINIRTIYNNLHFVY